MRQHDGFGHRAFSSCHIRFCATVISNLQTVSATLDLAFLALHRLFRRNRDRDGPGLCGLIHVYSSGTGVDVTLVPQPPREACGLGIVQLPFWYLTCACQFALFLKARLK